MHATNINDDILIVVVVVTVLLLTGRCITYIVKPSRRNFTPVPVGL